MQGNKTTDYIYKFRICTATCNRTYTLHRVFESLTAQTPKDFEWLIVDELERYRVQLNLYIPQKYKIKPMINCIGFNTQNFNRFKECSKLLNPIYLLLFQPFSVFLAMRDRIK